MFFNWRHQGYTPYLFDVPQLSTNKANVRRVNWCEIQNQQGTAYTFTNLKVVIDFICQLDHSDYIVAAHRGQRFDFQFQYQHFRSSLIV